MPVYVTEPRTHYREIADEHARQRCVVDLYRPTDTRDYPTIVFFRGGGLTDGELYLPEPLKDQGVAVAVCGYRLHPHVTCPTYIDDAAAAVAWVFEHIADFGGDPSKVLVAGYSAGAYLAMMLALDQSYLAKYGIDADRVVGYMPLAGQCITHMTIRKEQGHTPDWRPTIDRFAPLYHLRADARPMICVTGDWPLDLRCRAYENAYFVAMLKEIGHKDVEHVVIPGVGHEEFNPKFWPPALAFMRRLLDARPAASTTA